MAALPKVDKIWMDGELVDWDDGPGPRTHARAPLRLRRLRGHPLLRDRRRPRRLPPDRAHGAPRALARRCCAWTLGLHGRGAGRRHQGRHPRQRASRSATSARSSYRGYGVMGLDPLPAPVQTCHRRLAVGARYLGEEALQARRRRRASRRGASAASTPCRPQIKATGNYINSSLRHASRRNDHGYDEAILLNEAGNVCEGTGENIFVVRDGVIVTPPVSDGILEGITRDSIIAHRATTWASTCVEALARAHRPLRRRRDLHDAAPPPRSCRSARSTAARSASPAPSRKALQETYFKVVRGEDARRTRTGSSACSAIGLAASTGRAPIGRPSLVPESRGPAVRSPRGTARSRRPADRGSRP